MTNHEAMASLVDLYAGIETPIALEQLLSDDVVCRDWTMPGVVFRGRQAVWGDCFVPGSDAFEDASEEIIEVISNDTRLFIRAVFRARFSGAYRGVEPHGGTVSYELVDSYEFDDGRIVSMRFGANTMSLAVALGAVPPSAAPW